MEGKNREPRWDAKKMEPRVTVVTAPVEEYTGRAKDKMTWLPRVEMMIVAAQRTLAERLVRENRARRRPQKNGVRGGSGNRCARSRRAMLPMTRAP